VLPRRTWINGKVREIDASTVGAKKSQAKLNIKSICKNYRALVNQLNQADQGDIRAQMTKPEGGKPAGIPMGFENWDDNWPTLISARESAEVEVAAIV